MKGGIILTMGGGCVRKGLTITRQDEVKVKVTQSCLTLCDLMDYTVHGILQVRILEWVAIPFSRDQTHDQTHVSHTAGGFYTFWVTREVRTCLQCRRPGFDSWVRKIPWRMKWHSSMLTWRIPWTEEPGGLQSMRSHRIGHKWSDLACTYHNKIKF